MVALKWIMDKLRGLGLLGKAKLETGGGAAAVGGFVSWTVGRVGGRGRGRGRGSLGRLRRGRGEREGGQGCRGGRFVVWWYFFSAVFKTGDKHNSRGTHPRTPPSNSPADNYLPLDSFEEWTSALATSKSLNVPLVVDFTASWCAPCKKVAPFYKKLGERYDGVFVTVDVDELDEVAEMAEVKAMPTFQVWVGGEKVDVRTGAGEEQLEDMVSDYCGEL